MTSIEGYRFSILSQEQISSIDFLVKILLLQNITNCFVIGFYRHPSPTSTVLGGSTALLRADRPSTVAILREHGVRLGIENHPGEKTALDMLRQIGDGSDGTIGTAIDTGWYATNGYDAVQAIRELYPHILHIHLKDVLAPGAHDTCRYGQGCVDIAGCVAALRSSGYTGFYSIEHEPELFDPTEDCAAMLPMLRGWLA